MNRVVATRGLVFLLLYFSTLGLSIQSFATNEATLSMFRSVSFVSIAISVVLATLSLIVKRLSISQTNLVGALIITFAILFAFLRGSSLWAVDHFILTNLWLIFLALLLRSGLREGYFEAFSISIFFALLTVFFLNTIFGSMFNVEYGAAVDNYQGISRLSGSLFVVFAALAACGKFNGFGLIVLLSFTVLMGLIVISGGGRGELLFSFFAVLPYVLRRGLALAAASILVFFAVSNVDVLLEFRGFERLVFLLNDDITASRGWLARDAISLWLSSAEIFLLGCGFNCFQEAYGYDFGFYPHNYLLEIATTFGMVGIIPVAFCIYRLVILWLRPGENRYNLIAGSLGIYSLLVSLKSGSILGTFIVTFFVLLAGFGFFNRRPMV